MASSKSLIRHTLVKKGRRTYGAIYELPSGNLCYLAWRHISEVFRSGEKTNSDAVRKGTASWAIDEETLIMLRLKKIPYVGVLVRESRDVYLSTLERFTDRRFSKVLDYSGRNGAMQRYLPINSDNFLYRAGTVKI